MDRYEKDTLNKSSKKMGVGDWVWAVIIGGIVFVFVWATISDGEDKFFITPNDIFTIVGSITVLLFGIVGIFEFGYSNGISFLAPPTYRRCKESVNMKQAERMMKIYYKEDMDFIQQYEKERIRYILQLMGITAGQFHLINYEIIKARSNDENCDENLSEELKSYILHKEFIEVLPRENGKKRVYEKVDYYINLYMAFYDAEICKNVAGIMCKFIIGNLKEETEWIDYIIVPQQGNFLLGLEVAKQLHKPVIAIQSTGRIWQEEYWDGKYKSDRKNKIIVVHDVLVTGQNIIDSIKKLPENTYKLMGVYSLVEYSGLDDINVGNNLKGTEIESSGIKCLIKVDKNKLKEIVDGS